MMKQVRAVTVIVSVFIIASPAWTAPEGNEEYKRLIKTAVKEALREKILNVQPPAGAEPALETRRHLRTEKLEEAIPEKKPEQERTREKPRRGHRAERSQFVKPQSLLMKRVLKKEKSRRRREDLAGIIRNIDKTYGSIYTNLKKGKKLVIFFDPAHGKLANGQWQGEATNRMSATNRPEEFYSIMLSRGLYKQLSANRHIEVKSTPDFMEVLRGKKETYKNIPFTETVKMASQVGAFIILSEHLNNVSIFHKASGTTNLKGLHIVMDHSGRRILKYVHGQYSGFLTLYNKLDASGFSKEYALKLREKLIERNLNPNSWEKGAVGDDRFSYFVDFPISIIYESGFISHPDEEEE
ncbi:MAG: hypothetical protein GY754_22025, partial [bacterium]|nr:hypothetical protein [bacterium]